MPLKVLGAGFGRTGTLSLKRALEELGFGLCHHMYEVRQIPQQVDWWLSAAKGGTQNWDAIFKDFSSQVDWPASFFWKDLSAHFPDAKVILTDRDPESWYESISKTILPATEIGRIEDPDPVNRKASEMIYQIVLQNIFNGQLGDRDYAIKRFLDHRAEVIDTIPADRLLVYKVGAGWDSLCDFLQTQIPDTPFPVGNSVSEFRARKQYLEG